MSLRNVHKTNENLGISQFSQLWEQHSKLDPEKYRRTSLPLPPILFDEKIAFEKRNLSKNHGFHHPKG